MFDPKKLGEEADKMITELNQKQAETLPSSEEQDVKSEAIAQEVANKTPDDQGVPSAEVVGTTEEVVAKQDDTNAEVERLRKQADAAEQKWKVLQGMINKKDEEIDALRTLFAQLNTSTDKGAAPTSQAPQELITKSDIEEYGNDLVDMVRRAAKSVALAELASLRAELDSRFSKIEGTVSNVEQHTAKTAQEMFFDALTDKVSDWRTLNVDSGFLAWLQEEDLFTGAPRQQLLQHAVSNGDAVRAAAFFSTYKESITPSVPAPIIEAEVQAEEQPARPKVEKFLAPGKSKATVNKVDAASKRVWSRTDISKLYSDKMTGKISAKEADELERDIFAAQQEGRIAA